MADDIKLDTNPKSMSNINIIHETQKMQIEAGALGLFFGAGKNAPTNVVGVVLILLILLGCVYTFFNTSNKDAIESFWKIITPIITLAIGHLISGKRQD
ncbi:MAG: hypothetical protein HQL03_12385 [Nitrospirae bacterium]|nr:hypothetical protein [Nitrospirota bacterium]